MKKKFLVAGVIIVVIALLGLGVQIPAPMLSPSYTTSIRFEGFSLTQNSTHLTIEDYSSEWAPQYSISLENDTTLFYLVPHRAAREKGVVAEYAYVSRNYTKEIYSLREIFERLPRKYTSYKLDIHTHNRQCVFILDNESQKFLFESCSYVSYVWLSPPGNTVYDVVLKDFNETVFQQIRERIFCNGSYSDNALDAVWRLVEWVDSNVEYSYLNSSYICDPLTFMEEKSGVCVDYAVFYASGLLAVGFSEAYVLTFDAGDEGHAAAGVEYNGSMLVLEQHLPIMELQDYIEYSEMILNRAIHTPIHAYKIKHTGNDFAVEFFKLDLAKFEDASPLDGLTDEFVKDIEQSLSQKLKANITKMALPCYWEWSWEMLRFYTPILHAQWVEYISNLIANDFIEEKINPQYLTVNKANSTILLVYYAYEKGD